MGTSAKQRKQGRTSRPRSDSGVKHDHDKVPLDLLPFDALERVGEVLQHGAKKYAPRNWERGMRWGRLLGAAFRHLFAWARGQNRDPETGFSHLAHAACCVLFLLAYEERGIGTDDRNALVAKKPNRLGAKKP